MAADRPLRVVRIIDRLNIGGPAKHVVWLTAGLPADRFTTSLITGTVPDGEGDMSYFAHAAGVVPIVISEMSRELSPRDAVVTLKLLRELWRAKPDIVHTHKAKAGATGRFAALIYRWATISALWLRPRACRVVHTYHGHVFHSYYGPLKTNIFLAIERIMARVGTDCIIAISERQRQEICDRFRVGRPSQFRIINLGLDCAVPPVPDGRLRAQFGIRSDEPLVGVVGRLSEVKNHTMLFEAAALLAAEGVRARFVVIGDGHLRPSLEQQVARLGLDKNVIFTGFREDALELYGELDIVALTSLNEGTPLTLIEAMSAGRAIAASEVGGVPDIMGARRQTIEGFTLWEHGVTAPSQDPAAFARALKYLLANPAVRSEMGRLGAVFVRARLSRERLLDDVGQLYRDLLMPRKDAAVIAVRS